MTRNVQKPANRTWSPDLILARFRRRSPICQDYIVADAKTTSLLQPLIEFDLNAATRTVISGSSIYGVFAGTEFEVDHRLGTLRWEPCFADGGPLPDKMAMVDADHVLINENIVIWVPNEVLFPFLNLMLLIRGNS